VLVQRLEEFNIGLGQEAYADMSVPGGQIARRPVMVMTDPNGTVQMIVPLNEAALDVLMVGLQQAKADMHAGIVIAPADALPRGPLNGSHG
jgi:hypothetical protein